MRESLFLGAVGQKAEVANTHEAFGRDIKQETADERILGGPEFVYRAARQGRRDAERWQLLLESCKAIKVATSRRIRPLGSGEATG